MIKIEIHMYIFNKKESILMSQFWKHSPCISKQTKKSFLFCSQSLSLSLSPLRKEIIQKVAEQRRQLDHVWHWKETPESETLTMDQYDKFMVRCGENASLLTENLAGVKGQVAARNALAKKS